MATSIRQHSSSSPRVVVVVHSRVLLLSLSIVACPALVLLLCDPAVAFAPKLHGCRSCRVESTTTKSSTALFTKNPKTSAPRKRLGLLTFDLDDSLYPIAPVLEEANRAFARSMEQFGFLGIQPSDIVETARQIREEDPAQFVMMTHTEIRQLAIRREMEQVILQRKLQETADDWATPVSDLSPIVVQFAKKWAREAVSESVVQAVLNAWEMERHHAAERHLYPEIMPVLAQIKQQHPDVMIGAVTDGKANPLFMTFTLAKFFNFCTSWEDDQGKRKKFFQELSAVSGNAELQWIYDLAKEKYIDLATAEAALKKKNKDKVTSSAATAADSGDAEESSSEEEEDLLDLDNRVWIHVGDDLAYDVAGSAQSGARTIYLELAPKYRQSARFRFSDVNQQPAWSTTSRGELEKRRVMNELALDKIDVKIQYLSRLPEAIQEILDKENEQLAASQQESIAETVEVVEK